MITVKEIKKSEAGLYLNNLILLIENTIKLSETAKSSFKNQWTSDKIEKEIGNWLFLTAVDDGNDINGLILGTPPEGGVGTIIWVLVNNNNQQKGIGSHLFNYAKLWYKQKGAHKIKLTVPDKKTVNFYLKQGMKLEGEHLNHWWNNDFWSMGIDLT
jgi:GNAT superfamily N-acetyltransferase